MILTHEFRIEAPIDRVWRLLDELENVIPCMPGAAYDGRDGDDHKVSMKVKIGAISSHFKGLARFLQKDDTTHTAVVRGVGKDIRGKDAATAIVTAKLEALSPNHTRVILKTDLSMTGRLAQFGRGIITDIASFLISQFTANLHRKVLAQPNIEKMSLNGLTSTSNADGMNNVVHAEQTVNLGSIIGSVALKYGFKWIAIPLGFLMLGWLIGRFY